MIAFSSHKNISAFNKKYSEHHGSLQLKLQALIIQVPLYYPSSGPFQEIKPKQKFKLLAPKVVSVTYTDLT